MLCPGPWPTTARVGTAGSAPTALQTAAEAGTSEKCPKCYNSKSSEIGQKRITVSLDIMMEQPDASMMCSSTTRSEQTTSVIMRVRETRANPTEFLQRSRLCRLD